MGEIQLWQSEGLGADRDTLERVINIFKTDGVQGIKSQQALDGYIKTLSDSSLRDMCEIDEETAMQILADCFGVCRAFKEVTRIMGYVTTETATSMGWISPAAYREVVGKYEERTKKLNEEIDSLRHDYSIKNYEKEEADQQIKDLQNTLAHCKADLYDFYAQAGKLPKYERG